jgi:hypothetical protein
MTRKNTSLLSDTMSWPRDIMLMLDLSCTTSYTHNIRGAVTRLVFFALEFILFPFSPRIAAAGDASSASSLIALSRSSLVARETIRETLFTFLRTYSVPSTPYYPFF